MQSVYQVQLDDVLWTNANYFMPAISVKLTVNQSIITLFIAPSTSTDGRRLTWSWTGLPGRRPSAGRQDSRSTTPAVIVDLGIVCTVYATTVGDRAFPVAAARTWNSRSDVIKFPANLQSKTKISFILCVLST